MKVLITGHTSGLGRSLSNQFATAGHKVFGISRSCSGDTRIWEETCDFRDLEDLSYTIRDMIQTTKFDYVFLNAGDLGPIRRVADVTISEFNNSFKVNVLANKVIIDHLLSKGSATKFIGISSGAALNSYFGWSTYCCTKAAFKQLLGVYGDENPNCSFLSLAPGLIKTKMQRKIKEHSAEEFPSLSKFHKAYDTMPGPDVVAAKIIKNLPDLFTERFVDLRSIA